jgi:WD40 repeat protein
LHTDFVRAFSFSESKANVLTVGWDKKIYVWNANSSKAEWNYEHKSEIYNCYND